MKIEEIVGREWRHFRLALDGRILTVQLATAGYERNDFDAGVISELADIAGMLHRNTEVDVVILTSAKDVFSAGTAPSAFAERFSAPTMLERRHDAMPGADMVEAWSKIEAITIAAIDGRCRGAASVLSVNCDFRIMGEGVEFFFPEVPAGMILGWNAISRLVALCGPSRTKQMVLFGEFLDAKTCDSWGLADEIAPAGEAHVVARRWAEKLAALPPLAVRMTKEAVDSHSTALDSMSSAADRYRYLLAAHVRLGHLK